MPTLVWSMLTSFLILPSNEYGTRSLSSTPSGTGSIVPHDDAVNGFDQLIFTAIVRRDAKLLVVINATLKSVSPAMAGGTLRASVPGTKKRRAFLTMSESRGGRDAIDAVLQLSSERAIIMPYVDVVPNFVSYVERNPRDANVHGSTLMLPNPTTSQRLHTEARFKSFVKIALKKILVLLDDHESLNLHGPRFTMKKLLCVNNRRNVMTNWSAGRIIMAKTTNTILAVLQKYLGPVILTQAIVPAV